MTNMSYCRFRNTLSDLMDCYDSDDMFDPEDLSEDEKISRRRLIEMCHRIADEVDVEEYEYI